MNVGTGYGQGSANASDSYAVPAIDSISHFAFGWQTQEVDFSRSRQVCKL
jgi:hypothetical protein